MNPLVALLLLNGAPVDVQAGLVVALEAVPPALLPVGVPAGTYITFVNAQREAVQGTMLAVAAALMGAPPAGVVEAAGYGPAFVASGGGACGGFGTWRAHRIQTMVIIEGVLAFSPAVPGVAELVTFTLPALASFQPTPFANVYDLSGGVSLSNPAASTATLPQATVAALTGESSINCAGPTEYFAFTFSYSAV